MDLAREKTRQQGAHSSFQPPLRSHHSLVSLWDLEHVRILLGPRTGKEKPSGAAAPSP